MPYAGAPSDPLRARAVPAIYRSNALATPNYSYEKRQRELAKKRKAEEKRQKKGGRVGDNDGGPADNSTDNGSNGGNAPPTTPNAG